MRKVQLIICCLFLSLGALRANADWSLPNPIKAIDNVLPNLDPTNKNGGLRKTVDGVGEATGIKPGRWAGEAINKFPQPRTNVTDGAGASFSTVMTDTRRYYIIANDSINNIYFSINGQEFSLSPKRYKVFSYQSAYGSNSGNVQNKNAPIISYSTKLGSKSSVSSFPLDRDDKTGITTLISKNKNDPTVFTFSVTGDTIDLNRKPIGYLNQNAFTQYRNKIILDDIVFVDLEKESQEAKVKFIARDSITKEKGILTVSQKWFNLPIPATYNEWLKKDASVAPTVLTVQTDNDPNLIGFVVNCQNGKIKFFGVGIDKGSVMPNWAVFTDQYPFTSLSEMEMLGKKILNSPAEQEAFGAVLDLVCRYYPIRSNNDTNLVPSAYFDNTFK